MNEIYSKLQYVEQMDTRQQATMNTRCAEDLETSKPHSTIVRCRHKNFKNVMPMRTNHNFIS